MFKIISNQQYKDLKEAYTKIIRLGEWMKYTSFMKIADHFRYYIEGRTTFEVLNARLTDEIESTELNTSTLKHWQQSYHVVKKQRDTIQEEVNRLKEENDALRKVLKIQSEMWKEEHKKHPITVEEEGSI